ncbi:hypothetical protein F4825DRAFT_417539 [Nemania diffusa]|nr:hypothetical protein F4825DRAFT_417539 [Nemania diffusa]
MTASPERDGLCLLLLMDTTSLLSASLGFMIPIYMYKLYTPSACASFVRWMIFCYVIDHCALLISFFGASGRNYCTVGLEFIFWLLVGVIQPTVCT